jgi:hypothetical protein
LSAIHGHSAAVRTPARISLECSPIPAMKMGQHWRDWRLDFTLILVLNPSRLA